MTFLYIKTIYTIRILGNYIHTALQEVINVRRTRLLLISRVDFVGVVAHETLKFY